MDAHKNLAYSLVATAPSPAVSGTSLVVTAGEGVRFPAVPFNVTIWPVGNIPHPANAEIARVTARTTDTLTITRAQEGTTARTVLVGDQIAATITALTITDIENAIPDIEYFGAWSSGTAYKDGEVAIYNGVPYMAVKPSTNQAPVPFAITGAGLTGPQGPAGTPGDNWLYGTGAPSPSADVVGTLYLDGTTGNIWEQQAGGWVFTAINIRGPQGATGNTGSTGPAGPTNPWQMGQTWAVMGALVAGTLPGIFVPKLAAQTVTLKGVRAKIASGTSVVAQMRRNGTNQGSAITVNTTAATTSFNQVLAGDDVLDVVLSTPTGTPADLSLTAYLEYLAA